MNLGTNKDGCSSTSKPSHVAAPLFITIGPQSCGKTTWLKRQGQEKEFIDICLDDQPNVYVPIPTEIFCMEPNMLHGSGLLCEQKAILNRTIFGKSVLERLLDPEQFELRWLLLRLSGRISSEQFEKHLLSNALELKSKNQAMSTTEFGSGMDEELVNERVSTLSEVVEEMLGSRPLSLPDTVDLFVVESLFQKESDDSSDQTNFTAIERAIQLLHESPRDISIAWGNTNTKPRDYSAALDVAQQQQRPVFFCVYDALNYQTVPGLNKLFDVPYVGFRELLRRNVNRLRQTGRYVPSRAIWEASERVERLVGDVINQATGRKESLINWHQASNTTVVPTKLEFEQQLARLAQFEMGDDRIVMRRNQPQMKQNSHQNNGFQTGRGHENGGTSYRNRNTWQSQSHPSRLSRSSKQQPEQRADGWTAKTGLAAGQARSRDGWYSHSSADSGGTRTDKHIDNTKKRNLQKNHHWRSRTSRPQGNDFKKQRDERRNDPAGGQQPSQQHNQHSSNPDPNNS